MMHCLRLHHGDFFYRDSWRLTTFFPRERPQAMPQFASLAIRGFASDFLYRRWCRSHMELKDFGLPDAATDPFAKRVAKLDVADMTYQQYFEYVRVCGSCREWSLIFGICIGSCAIESTRAFRSSSRTRLADGARRPRYVRSSVLYAARE